MIRATAVLLAVVASVLPSVAHAEPAEKLFDRASAAMDRGAYADACVLFDQSYTESRATGPLLGLAACNEARGRYHDALVLFREAAHVLPPESPSTWQAREAIRRLQDRVGVLTVELAADAPSSTRVAVDGVVSEIGGRGIELDPAVNHSVVAIAPGHVERETEVRLGEGEHRRVTIAPGEARPGIGPVRGAGIALLTLSGGSFLAAAVTGGILIANTQTIDQSCTGPNHTICNGAGLGAENNFHQFLPWNIASLAVGATALGIGIPMVVAGDSAGKKHTGPSVVLAVRGSSALFEARF